MNAILLDVNLLIALAWPNHVHHELAHGWFAQNSHQGWATCPVTQLGFVRVSANSLIVGEPVSIAAAFEALRTIVALPDHVFWPDELAPCDVGLGIFALVMGHRQITDAYLLSLAIARGSRLATLDAKMKNLLPPKGKHDNALIIV